MHNAMRTLQRRLHLSLVTIALLEPECKVCGQHVDIKLLRPFPGAPDMQACPRCCNEYGEVPADGIVH
ncbi:hypothetical protein [Cohnella sp. GbtcB17]|uniref:hypothetical protein n=1 Tax=Cohnella sp. GbtcB17 TaxID=2824762 RepID=UPI001C3001EB|nr:hypothetical protein [Cohnella sp. GbtcB17]